MIAPRLLARLTEQRARLDALRPLSTGAVRRLEQIFAVEWTYNSNAIEGNTLTMRETQLILEPATRGNVAILVPFTPSTSGAWKVIT